MGQLSQDIIFYNDNTGAIRPGSQHTFFEAGTTTPKDVFADPDLTTPLGQPVVSAADGILPQIWLGSGAYRWIGKDNTGNQFFNRDNINLSESTLNLTSAIFFENEADLIAGFDITGSSVNLQAGQTARTQGSSTPTDNGGREFYIDDLDLGGGLLLNNGRYANPQQNFASINDIDLRITDHDNGGIGDVHDILLGEHNADSGAHGDNINDRITAHDDLSLNNVHTTMMLGHNGDSVAHGSNIDGRISTHNGSGSAHSDIRLLIDKLRYINIFVTGTTVLNNHSLGTIQAVSVTNPSTGVFNVTFNGAMHKVSYSGVCGIPINNEVIFAGTFSTNQTVLTFNTLERGTQTLEASSFHATITYDDIT